MHTQIFAIQSITHFHNYIVHLKRNKESLNILKIPLIMHGVHDQYFYSQLLCHISKLLWGAKTKKGIKHVSNSHVYY